MLKLSFNLKNKFWEDSCLRLCQCNSQVSDWIPVRCFRASLSRKMVFYRFSNHLCTDMVSFETSDPQHNQKPQKEFDLEPKSRLELELKLGLELEPKTGRLELKDLFWSDF